MIQLWAQPDLAHIFAYYESNMRLSVTFLTTLLIGATAVSAHENLYIGTIGGCGSNKYGPDWFVWPTDSPACTSGVDLGPTNYFGNSLCGRNVTLSDGTV